MGPVEDKRLLQLAEGISLVTTDQEGEAKSFSTAGQK